MSTTRPGANVRNWIVQLVIYDDDNYQYGPYTKAAAKKAEARIQRWIDRREKKDPDNEGEMNVGSFPIHQWRRQDELESEEKTS